MAKGRRKTRTPIPKLAKLELHKAMQLNAEDIIAAARKGEIVHSSRNIAASGRFLEKAVCDVLRRLLPSRYHVGQGHVVDSKLKASPQYDVIIADSTNSPVLFQDPQGTEWFPYESVYAIGEVRPNYYKVKAKKGQEEGGSGIDPIQAFVKNLARCRSKLTREPVPVMGIYGDRVFSFMLFVKSQEAGLDEISSFYQAKHASELPNIVCFLDRGLILNVTYDYENGREGVRRFNAIPEASGPDDDSSHRWVFMPFSEGQGAGATLAFFFYMLMNYLSLCKLQPPRIVDYINEIFPWSEIYEKGKAISFA
jgi:hypothetical protein